MQHSRRQYLPLGARQLWPTRRQQPHQHQLLLPRLQQLWLLSQHLQQLQRHPHPQEQRQQQRQQQPSKHPGL
jgi:hypothetical protein